MPIDRVSSVLVKNNPIRRAYREAVNDLRRILFLRRRADDKVLFHTRMRHKQLFELIHLELIVLASPRRVNKNKVLAAVARNRLSEICGGVNDFHRQPPGSQHIS